MARYSLKVVGVDEKEFAYFEQIPIGRFVRFTNGGSEDSGILLRTYSGLVSLEDPRRTWSTINPNTRFVLLPEGTTVEITSGNLFA